MPTLARVDSRGSALCAALDVCRLIELADEGLLTDDVGELAFDSGSGSGFIVVLPRRKTRCTAARMRRGSRKSSTRRLMRERALSITLSGPPARGAGFSGCVVKLQNGR
ncbi:MAG TPA: hypothetical protein VER33_27520 [Polyangiaceae bacterium]|nr:hypothetical protein [Polyangiaceae bacterium]